MNSTTRKKYPAKWKKMSRQCKERAGWRCRYCDVGHGTKRVAYSGREWPVWLVAAHINHDPWNESPELICVCPSCHWRYHRRPGQLPLWMIERRKHRILIQARGYPVPAW